MQLSLPAALGLLFIALKLTGFIAWSWIWVLCPFWIGGAIIFGFITITFLIGIIMAATDS